MLNIYLGLFTISLSTLLLELSLAKIFSVIIFSNYAFMIISTALLGFGLSGIFCSLSPGFKARFASPEGLSLFSILFGISSVLAFTIINNIPLQLAELHRPLQMINLGIYYLSLMIPFFFSGLVIVLLFSMQASAISRLYFFDLTGAGIGCLFMIPLFKYFGGSGAFFIIMGLGFWAALFFNNFKNKTITAVTILSLILISFFLPRIENLPLKVHDFKRTYKYDQENNNIEYSRWSALSKIDIALNSEPGWKRLWIDGGTNESALVEFDGRYPSHKVNQLDKLLISIPYLIKKQADIAIIGSSGGREVLIALNHNPASVDAIEMDPTICNLVAGKYSDYLGNIFHDSRTNLICDEGRSYIKRSLKKYDIIHQINNFTPIAMASGAINVAEAYLLTMESFEDYWQHLKENGLLVLNRHNTFKIAVLAQAFLEKKNLKASNHIIVIEGEDKLNNGFYLKKSPFTAQEIREFETLFKARNLNFLFSPSLNNPKNWYVRLLKHKQAGYFLKLKGLNLSPPTDDRPFFEHIEGYGKIDTSDPNLPAGLKWVDSIKKFGHRISTADLTLLVLIIEATIFSFLFIFLPLRRQNIHIADKKKEYGFLIYFFSIGLAFIILELCLIQKFVLFLGVPIYSIATVIFSLLLSSGIGSYLTKYFKQNLINKPPLIALLLITILGLYLILLQPILNMCLSYIFWSRILLTFSLIFPLGILMGMFFPLGIKAVNHKFSQLIPWVWGINAYATVIGSVLGVLIALYAGFGAVFIIASIVYISGALNLYCLCRE